MKGSRELAGYPSSVLHAADLEAVFLPSLGMLCASLKREGEERLGRTDELEKYVTQGSTLGIPLLHPWANRLGDFAYEIRGRRVELERQSPMLHYDGAGLPMHGVPGAKLPFEIVEESGSALRARLEWSHPDLLAVFPFPHDLEMRVSLERRALTIATTLTPSGGAGVPISFGFHPYVRLPDVPRAEWILELPELRRLVLDKRGIPTGVEEPYSRDDGQLGGAAFDDAFLVVSPDPVFTLRGGESRVRFRFLEGYPFTQIYAPRDKEFIAIEPMTAPGSALVSGNGLRFTEPGSIFRAVFRVEVD